MSRTFPSNDGRNHLEETHNDIMSTPGQAPGRPPPPAPPLPPPLPAESCEEKRSRMRSFFWKPIPEDCLKDQAGPNVWTRNRTDAAFHIDLTALEELFGEKDAHPTSTTRRKTDPKGASAQPLRQQISILDSRRCMNISIFLKHFKHSSECVLDAVLHGRSGVLPAEFLRKLLSLLPGREEVKKLKMFSGSLMDLPAADAFMHQLVLLPRYEDRLEALLLNEEFFSLHASMKQDTALVLSAVKELLNCEELHHVLHLVLQAGNFMNSGVSASVANAVGFRLSSLLSLADTKANKPGMNLLNFVALEAQKKNLLMFPEKLPHVQQAARVCVDSLQEEFNTLSTRVQEQEQILTTDEDLHTQFCSFLKKAKEALEDLRTSTSEMLREGHTLIQFFCEDQELFTLDDCFQVFQNFCCKFKRAVQENMERMIWEESRGKRLKEMAVKQHSRAGLEARGGVCGLRSTRETDMKRALVREGLVELLDASPLLQFGGVHRSRQRKICHSMTGHDMNSDPSAHHLLQGLTISDRTAPTNSEDHKDPISALDDITKSNSDIKCITKLEQTLRDEGLQTLQQNSRDEENFALRTLGLESHRNTITVTADPHNQPIAQHKGKTSAKLLPRPKSSHKAPPTTNALLTTQRSSKPVSQLIVRSSVSSETKSLSKVVSLSPSGPQNQVQGVARKKQVAPEVKMCSRLRATPPAPIVKTTAGFTRSSTTSKQPPLTRSASLRLSQLLKQTQTLSTAPMPPPAGHLRKSGNAITPSLPTRAPRKQ